MRFARRINSNPQGYPCEHFERGIAMRKVTMRGKKDYTAAEAILRNFRVFLHYCMEEWHLSTFKIRECFKGNDFTKSDACNKWDSSLCIIIDATLSKIKLPKVTKEIKETYKGYAGAVRL